MDLVNVKFFNFGVFVLYSDLLLLLVLSTQIFSSRLFLLLLLSKAFLFIFFIRHKFGFHLFGFKFVFDFNSKGKC